MVTMSQKEFQRVKVIENSAGGRARVKIKTFWGTGKAQGTVRPRLPRWNRAGSAA